MEVHGTQKWVWDYENSEEDNTQIVDRAATEPKDDDDTKDDEDMNNRVVLSRVVLTTGPSLDLAKVIAKKMSSVRTCRLTKPMRPAQPAL